MHNEDKNLRQAQYLEGEDKLNSLTVEEKKDEGDVELQPFVDQLSPLQGDCLSENEDDLGMSPVNIVKSEMLSMEIK